MCRHAAYIGQSLSLAECLLDPEHNLVEQAVHPKEMRIGRFNGDGFGFGWFTTDGKPQCYRNIQPIWSDINLSSLGHSLWSDQWIALVRGASPGLGISIDNTHPFRDERWLFTLNGIITNFASTLRSCITNRLSDRIAADIKGHTDAEFIFALLRQFAIENDQASTKQLIEQMVAYLTDIAGDVEIALSILLCEQGVLYATRYAINLPNPTLYYCERYLNGVAVASEPIGQRSQWSLVPEQHLLTATRDGSINFHALD